MPLPVVVELDYELNERDIEILQNHSGHYFPSTSAKILKSAIFRGLENQPFSSDLQLIDLQTSVRRFMQKLQTKD